MVFIPMGTHSNREQLEIPENPSAEGWGGKKRKRRITEPFGLEKPSKIIESSHPSTLPRTPLIMSPSATFTHLLILSRDGEPPTVPVACSQCLTTPSVKEFFLISNLKLPLAQLEAISEEEEAFNLFLIFTLEIKLMEAKTPPGT